MVHAADACKETDLKHSQLKSLGKRNHGAKGETWIVQ